MFEEKEPLKDFPVSFSIDGNAFTVQDELHYSYLNELANKLYTSVYGYIDRPDFDFYASSHPQESGCFAAAMKIDNWVDQHEYNSDR